MKEFLNDLKETVLKAQQDAILNSEFISSKYFLDMYVKLENQISKCQDSFIYEPIKERKTRTYDKLDEKVRDNVLLVAFCFSYYEHDSLYPTQSQDRALSLAAEALGTKKSTLKMHRDLFDGHNNNHRKGWSNSPMPPNVQKIKDYLETLDKKVVVEKAKKVLNL